MAAGIIPSLNSLNTQWGQLVLAFRNDCQSILNENAFIQNLGVAGLTAAPYSMTQADAELVVAIFGNLASLATEANGGDYVGPALPFNFVAQTIPLWGGQ